MSPAYVLLPAVTALLFVMAWVTSRYFNPPYENEQSYFERNPEENGMDLDGSPVEQLNARGLTIAKLLHVGWQSQDDHSLEPLDGDEGYVPPNSVPVFVIGTIEGEQPSLDLLADDD